MSTNSSLQLESENFPKLTSPPAIANQKKCFPQHGSSFFAQPWRHRRQFLPRQPPCTCARRVVVAVRVYNTVKRWGFYTLDPVSSANVWTKTTPHNHVAEAKPSGIQRSVGKESPALLIVDIYLVRGLAHFRGYEKKKVKARTPIAYSGPRCR